MWTINIIYDLDRNKKTILNNLSFDDNLENITLEHLRLIGVRIDSMLLIIIFHIRGGKMNKKEMKKEWPKVLKSFVDYHSKKIEGMTEEEEIKYVKENKINEKIQQLQKEFIKKYSTQKK